MTELTFQPRPFGSRVLYSTLCAILDFAIAPLNPEWKEFTLSTCLFFINMECAGDENKESQLVMKKKEETEVKTEIDSSTLKIFSNCASPLFYPSQEE